MTLPRFKEVICPHCETEIVVELEPSWSTEENDHILAAWEKHKPGNCLVNMHPDTLSHLAQP